MFNSYVVLLVYACPVLVKRDLTMPPLHHLYHQTVLWYPMEQIEAPQ